MKATTWGFIGVALAASVTVAASQSVPDTAAEHIASAQAAAGDLWPRAVANLCPPAPGFQKPVWPTPRLTPRDVPKFRHEGIKVADNLYVFPMFDFSDNIGGMIMLGGVSAWAVKTSQGLILFDTLYSYSVKEAIDQDMRKIGLNPADIKTIFLTHGHGDHFGGAKYLQETYSPTIYISEEDWGEMSTPPQSTYSSVPTKDKIAIDGQKFRLGDTTVSVYKTPGHTPGTLSFLIPVRINGKPHVAAFWGGTAVGGTTLNVDTYSASARRFAKIAAEAGADIVLSNHDAYGDYIAKAMKVQADPTGPNPFVVGVDGVQRFLRVLEHCAAAQSVERAESTTRR